MSTPTQDPAHTNPNASNKKMLARWIASGILFFVVIFTLTWISIPQTPNPLANTLTHRMFFAALHIFSASLLLFLGFLAVGSTRWHLETADPTANPAISGEKASEMSIHNRVHGQFLSNTTEQFLMFATAALAASFFLSTTGMKLLTVTTVVWIAGRFFFWGGYWYTAVKGLPTYPRAVGLATGLFCTIVMASVAAAGISLHFPLFEGLLQTTSATQTTCFGLLLAPTTGIQASNLIPLCFFSFLIMCMWGIAFFPKVSPPALAITIITTTGWGYLLLSGTIPLRF